MHKSKDDQIDPITWDRLKSIFGRQQPIRQVTQRQFDGFDDVLERLSRTPVESIDFADLWYYHHDLAYQTLQDDLFAHLFPACLMDWHESLLVNRPCSHGDSEFHYGIINGDVLRKMLTHEQRVKVEAVFRDSMLTRMDRERGLVSCGSTTPAYAWIERLNSLGQCSECLPEIWERWWKVETYGRAVCLLQYCSALIYFEVDNPIFKPANPAIGGGPPCLWESDCLFGKMIWISANVEFLESFLTAERVATGLRSAAEKLSSEPEAAVAAQLANDSVDQLPLVEMRLEQLRGILTSGDSLQHWWV